MSVPWDIRHRGIEVPKDFWDRDPVIEVWILCSRCSGDFASKTHQVTRVHTQGYPPRTLENCPDCTAGRQRVLVPLRSILRGLAWRREAP
jgi:hypothetical protein